MTKLGLHNSTMHLVVNRNKRSLTVDLRQSEGKEIFRRLIEEADVFVTGVVGRGTRMLGIDYESVRAIKPDIVYCQATGPRATGTYSEIPTHGDMMNALAGENRLEGS